MEKFLQKKRRIWAALVAIALFLVVAAPNLAHAQTNTFNCAAKTPPYSIDFNASGSWFPDCWSGFFDGSAIDPAASVSNSVIKTSSIAGPDGGGRTLCLYGKYYNGILISPLFTADVNTLTLSFALRASNSTDVGTIELGYLTNIASASTFVSVESYTYPLDAPTWQSKTKDLSSIPAGVKHFAIRHQPAAQTQYNYIWLDNFSIAETPSTPTAEETYGTTCWNGYVYHVDHDGNEYNPHLWNLYFIGTVTKNDQTFNLTGSSAALTDSRWGWATINLPTPNTTGWTVTNNPLAEHYILRLKRTIDFPCGSYTFNIACDDKIRVSFDGGDTWVMERDWTMGGQSNTQGPVYLGGPTNVVIESYENGGDWSLQFQQASYTAGACPCEATTNKGSFVAPTSTNVSVAGMGSSNYFALTACSPSATYQISSSTSAHAVVRKGSANGDIAIQGPCPLNFKPGTTGDYYVTLCAVTGTTNVTVQQLCAYTVQISTSGSYAWYYGGYIRVKQGDTYILNKSYGGNYSSASYNETLQVSLAKNQNTVVEFNADGYSSSWGTGSFVMKAPDGTTIWQNGGDNTQYKSPAFVVIDDCSACIPPAATQANSTQTSFDIQIASGTAWDIKVSTTPIDPATEAGDKVDVSNVSTNPYPVSGLTQETLYYVYVRSTGGCWSGTNTFSTMPEETYGDNEWNGYVYKNTPNGSAWNAMTFGLYLGSVKENPQFTRNSNPWTGRDGAVGTMPEDYFTARYLMKYTFPCGYYTFTVSADDNYRLSIDGGNTWLKSNWTNTTVSGTEPVYFDGNTAAYLVLEFNENSGGQSVNISWTQAGPPVTVSDNTTDEATVTIGGNVGSMWDIWFYKLSTTAIDPATQDGDMLNASTTNATFTLPNLNHSTTYYLYVQSPNCSWTTKTFMTQVAEEYGTTCWNGYLYHVDRDGNGANPPQGAFLGTLTINDTYLNVVSRDVDMNSTAWGWSTMNIPTPNTTGWSQPSNPLRDRFILRLRRTIDFACGTYAFNIKSDDKIRVSFDGGNTWSLNAYWETGDCCSQLNNQGPVYLSGPTNVVVESFENTGGWDLVFAQYSFVPGGQPATATAVGSTTATLTYAGTGDYTLKVSSTALSNPDAENGDVTGFENIIVTTPTIDLGGLIEGGNYYVYAKSRCADESCDAWGTSTFKTNSNLITVASLGTSEATGIYYDFSAAPFNASQHQGCGRPMQNGSCDIPDGWVTFGSSINGYYGNNMEVNAGSGFILPPFAADVNMSTLRVQILADAKNTGQSQNIAYVYVSDKTDGTDLTLVATVTDGAQENSNIGYSLATFSQDYSQRRVVIKNGDASRRMDTWGVKVWLEGGNATPAAPPASVATVDSKSVSIPAGTYYTENGFNACETGSYAKYISNTGGDTLVTRNITVNPVTIDTTVCQSQLDAGLELLGETFYEAVTGYTLSQPLACNCPNDMVINITVFDELVLTATPGTEVCKGSTAELSATGTGFSSFLWNTGETTTTITTAPITEETVYSIEAEKGPCVTNVSVTLKPILLPSNLTITSIGINSADFAFTPGENNTGWQAVCMTAGKTPDWGAAINLTSPEGSLANLEAATNYTLYLRAGECDYTSIDFKTEGDYATVPALKVDFEDDAENNNWTLGGGDNAWIVGNATGNAGKSLYISNNGQDNEYTSTGAPTWTYATRNITVTTAGDYYFAYDWKSKGEMEDFDMARVFIISYQPTPLPQGDINTIFSDAAYRSPLLGGVSGWQHVRELVNLQAGNYKIAFLWKNDAGTGFQNPVAIDNVRLDNFTCDAPVALAVNNILAEKADITWNSPGIACEWILAWKEATASAWTETTVAGTSYTLTDLIPSTAYNVRVKSVCATTDETKESAWANKDFTTIAKVWNCDKPKSLTTTNLATESITISWTKGGTETAWDLEYKKTSSTAWTALSCIATSQNLTNLTPGTSYEVRVRALCTVENPSDWATTSFTTNPACAEPLNLSVIDLSSNATTATATLSWGFGSEASWSVEYKKEADANYTAATVSTNSRTLTNLALNTKYNARVRAICGTNVYSGYVNVSFTTPAASLAEHTITVSVNPVSAGTVTPMGAVKITDGGSKTFAIALDSRYDWTDNTPTGITLTGSSKTGFTVSNVKADAQVVVNAKLKTYTVTATAGANGTIDPAGTTTVNYGEDVLYTITPATGYFVKNVTVDGKDLGSLTQYRFTFANANHTIGATFEKAVTPKTEYTITPEAGANGSISPAVPQQVVAGSYRKFEFVPNEGYKVNEIWIDDTVKLAATMSYTFFNVHSDHKIKVTFIENRGNVDGINDYRAEGNFLLYPNPTSGEITIDNGMSNLKTVGVYDLLGKLHLLVPCEKQAKQTLNVSNLAAGTYLLRVETTEGIYTRKFVKE